MINKSIKNKPFSNQIVNQGASHLNALTNSKLERDQYYRIVPVGNRSSNSPYQQMKGQLKQQQQSNQSNELPPANLNSDRFTQQALVSNSQNNNTAPHKIAISNYGSQQSSQNKTQLPQLSRIADRSHNNYQKYPNQRSSTKTNQKQSTQTEQSKWNASRFSDNGSSSFQNYSAQAIPSQSSNQRINPQQMETSHQREVSQIIEKCIEMAPKRGSAMNPFASRVENSANSTVQSSNSNPPPILGILPQTKNNIVSKAQSSHSLKSDQYKQEGPQLKESSQTRGPKYGANIQKNRLENQRERASAQRINNEIGSQYLSKYNASSGTALRDKLYSNEQSQEILQGIKNQNNIEQEDWIKWRKWQNRNSGKQRGQIVSDQDDQNENQAFKKKESFDFQNNDFANNKGSNLIEKLNKKAYSIHSDEEQQLKDNENVQRRSRVQRMARNNDDHQYDQQNKFQIQDTDNQKLSDRENPTQKDYNKFNKLPDPQHEKIQNNLAPFLGGPPTISSQSWAIFDCNDQCLLKGKFETMRREVASITKMMTFYTVICIMDEFKIDPKKTLIAVSRMASSVTGTTADLREGDVLSLYQLFYAMMLPSGNDAAFTLGEYFGEFIRTEKYNFQHSDKIFGNIHLSPFYGHPTMKYFLREMNLNAQKLNMFDTFYDSPHGLRNERNFSTAYDVALLTNECMKIPLFRQVVGTGYIETRSLGNQVAMRNFNERKLTQYHWESTNKLLGCLDGLIGCKTGITTAAGPCFAGYYEADGLKLAVILCCSRSMEIRWIEIQRLVAYVKSAVAKYNQMKDLQEKKKQRMDSEKGRFTRHRFEGGL